jgi:hypothetical protein
VTRLASRPLSRWPDVDLRKTRSRFLLARAQTGAHARTADYLRARETGLAELTATARDARTS